MQAQDQLNRGESSGQDETVLDGVLYPRVNIPDIPSGTASVPVRLDDNGEIFECTMIAGSAAIQAAAPTAEQEAAVSSKSAGNTMIQPMSGWWMCINEDESVVKANKEKVEALTSECYQYYSKIREATSEDEKSALKKRQIQVAKELSVLNGWA